MVRRTLASAQKKAETEGRTIIWIDQSGFYLLPAVVRTYAPRGQTPVLSVPLMRDHLAVISGITLEGALYFSTQERPFRSPEVVRFLRHLLRHIHGLLLVIWDGSPIHRGQMVKEFLANGGAKRLQVEQLPGYAPDLNPDEFVWRHLKHVELRNRCCPDIPSLRRELRLAIARLRHKPNVIKGCIRHAGYNV